MSSGWLTLQKKEYPRERLDDVPREKTYLAYPFVCLREFLMRRDTCPDLGVSQKLTTTLVKLQTWLDKSSSSLFIH